jgi:hypothetical protein
MPGRSWVSRLSLVESEPVPVPEVLSSPHRLTLQLQKSFSRRIPDSYGRVLSSGDDIVVKVEPASIPRALLFVDAFVKAAEERGYAFTPRVSDYESGMSILIEGTKVQFSIFEKSHRVMPTRSKVRYRSPSVQSRIEFRPTGRFCFRIREALSACREPTFSDRPEHPFESQLSTILHGLSIAAFELRERAEKRETERRVEEELARQHRLARARSRKLNDHLEDWTRAEALRRLIAHLERKVESEVPADPSYAREWLDWARTEADNLDPTSESLDDFFDNYRRIARPISSDDFDDDLRRPPVDFGPSTKCG